MVTEKIEQTQRNYYPGNPIPETVQSTTTTNRKQNEDADEQKHPDNNTTTVTKDKTGSQDLAGKPNLPNQSTATTTFATTTKPISSNNNNNMSDTNMVSEPGPNNSDSGVTNADLATGSSGPATTTNGPNNGNSGDVPDNAQLISRTTQQIKTQQVKTITKTFTTREVRHFGPDGQPIDPPPPPPPPLPSIDAPSCDSTTETNNNNNLGPAIVTNGGGQNSHLHQNNNLSSSGDYTNFPGPKQQQQQDSQDLALHQHHHLISHPQQTSQANFDSYTNQQFNNNNNDPHYSNTSNYSHLVAQQQQPGIMAPSPSPGSGSTVNTGSTGVATFVNAVQQQRMYDPYSTNNQIGYQDYSNFNNYQEMAHINEMNMAAAVAAAAGGASPQPPIRRHLQMVQGPPPPDEPTYVQTAHGPVAYGYATGGGHPAGPGGMTISASQLPIPMNQQAMHSPGGASAIYGNFEHEAPQGYLDRRQTYDDGQGTYGQMMGGPGRGPPMYEDAESAYQHIQALQAAGVMDAQQAAAIFFQNGPGNVPMPPPSSSQLVQSQAQAQASRGVGLAPGSGAVTAIGPDGVRWRDPDLHEVIEFLAHPNSIVRANAAAYLQHLCFMDDSMKAKTRALGGIPALINLLAQDVPEIQRNACGALRNLSYGRQNDENKRAIRAANGITGLVRLLRKTPDNEIRELATSVLWNLSSCEELKRPIIDDALQTLVLTVIIPHSGWDRNSSQQQQQASAQQAQTQQVQQPPIYWSTVFRNASGVLRNISSAGEYARKRIRECEGLVDSLLFLVRAAIGKNDMDNKSVENCVCVLRNLSYRCQEVIDPEYDKHPPGVNPVISPPPPSQSSTSGVSTSASSNTVGGMGGGNGPSPPSSTLSPSSSSSSKNSTSSLMGGLSSKVGENLSCFGGSKKKSSKHQHNNQNQNDLRTLSPSVSISALEAKTGQLSLKGGEVPKGMELLWQTEVVQPYLALLSECSNPETLEAAAGAIQNLAACYWQPSVDIRGAVRKEKGLPILVELLRMEVDRVVCAVATALRNLAMDTRNKELIGKYALKDLVSKLPTPSATGIPLETGTSDDTVAAVLATLNEVVAKNADFAKSLLEAGGMQRLSLITKHRNRFSTRVVKFTSQLLYNMWQHTELREVYRKAGWKESHFLVTALLSSSGSSRGVGAGANTTGTLRNGQSMTASASGMTMMGGGGGTPSTPSNGQIPGSASSLYQSISANNTLSRPMSTVGGTKYEDHTAQQFQLRNQSNVPASNSNGGNSTLTRGQHPMHGQIMAHQSRMQEELLLADLNHQQQQQQMMAMAAAAAGMDGPSSMSNGGGGGTPVGTLVRPPIGGVSIFPPGAAPGEPVYAQVNRERKRQQQQLQQQLQLQAQQQQLQAQHSPNSSVVRSQLANPNQLDSGPVSVGSAAAVSPGGSGETESNYHNVLDPSSNEPIYPKSMPAGDSWV